MVYNKKINMIISKSICTCTYSFPSFKKKRLNLDWPQLSRCPSQDGQSVAPETQRMINGLKKTSSLLGA